MTVQTADGIVPVWESSFLYSVFPDLGETEKPPTAEKSPRVVDSSSDERILVIE